MPKGQLLSFELEVLRALADHRLWAGASHVVAHHLGHSVGANHVAAQDEHHHPH